MTTKHPIDSATQKVIDIICDLENPSPEDVIYALGAYNAERSYLAAMGDAPASKLHPKQCPTMRESGSQAIAMLHAMIDGGDECRGMDSAISDVIRVLEQGR